MVIPYAGALNAFLTIYQNLPLPIRSFVVTSIVLSLGVGFLRIIRDL